MNVLLFDTGTLPSRVNEGQRVSREGKQLVCYKISSKVHKTKNQQRLPSPLGRGRTDLYL